MIVALIVEPQSRRQARSSRPRRTSTDGTRDTRPLGTERHDPTPLYDRFAVERAGEFTWEYLETGPEGLEGAHRAPERPRVSPQRGMTKRAAVI